MAAAQVTCPSCGFKNPHGSKRCVSCGAKIVDIKVERSRQEMLERRYQQEAFSVTWLLIALAVQAVLTGAIIMGLPQVVGALDFEGSHGMLTSIGIWFVGGMLVGMISPGRTFLEPVIASFIVAIPTVLFLYKTETVFTLPPILYVVLGAIGIMFALIGSYLGERIQLGPAPKPTD
jgi:hypothetical protein